MKFLGLPVQQPKESLVASEKKGLAPFAHTSRVTSCESSAEWIGVYVGVACSIQIVGLWIPSDRKILVILQKVDLLDLLTALLPYILPRSQKN